MFLRPTQPAYTYRKYAGITFGETCCDFFSLFTACTYTAGTGNSFKPTTKNSIKKLSK